MKREEVGFTSRVLLWQVGSLLIGGGAGGLMCVLRGRSEGNMDEVG
jgi:hypothetical protein